VHEKIQAIPDGYTAVTPWIIVKGAARFLDFIKEVFGAEELARVYNQDGSIGHAEARIGDAIVMMFDSGEDWPDTPQFLRLYVDDANAVFARALAAGSRSVTEVTELGFGDQVGRFADPWNNIWWVQERLDAPSLEEMGKRMEEPRYADAMRYVQESLGDEMRRRETTEQPKHP
jgi:PhnB protein